MLLVRRMQAMAKHVQGNGAKLLGGSGGMPPPGKFWDIRLLEGVFHAILRCLQGSIVLG